MSASETHVSTQSTPPSPDPAWEEGISFADFSLILVRSWKTVLFFALGGALAGGLWSLLMLPRTWESTVHALMPQPLQSAGVGAVAALPGSSAGGGGALANLVGSAPSLGDTYKIILESDSVRESLAEEFHLGPLMMLNSREERLKALAKILQVKMDPKSGLIAVTATIAGTPQFPLLRRRIRTNWGPGDVNARQLSADVANRSLQLLQEYLNKSNLFQSRKYRSYMEQERKRTLAELRIAQQELLSFQRRRQVFSPSDETQSLVRIIQDFNKQKITCDVTVKQVQAEIDTVSGQLRAEALSPLSLPSDNPIVQKYRHKLIDQEAQLSIKQQELTDSHPDVIKLRLALEETQKQIHKEVGRVLNATQSRLAPQLTELVVRQIASESQSRGLASVISQLQSKLVAMPPTVIGYSQLKADVDILDRRYRLYDEQLQQARMAEVKDPTGFVLLDRAVPPTRKSAPTNSKNVVLAGMLGLMFSILAVFASENLRKGIRTS